MAFLVGTGVGPKEENLSIFNSIVHVGSNPPLLGLVFRPLTVERHTYDHIKNYGALTLNSVPLKYYRSAHATSAKYPKDVSEFDRCGFSPGHRDGFAAPYVVESPLRIGCSLSGEYPLKENQCIFMVVRIEWVQTLPGAIEADGFLDHTQLGNTGVIGLDAYYSAHLQERLAYAQPDRPIEPLDHGS